MLINFFICLFVAGFSFLRRVSHRDRTSYLIVILIRRALLGRPSSLIQIPKVGERPRIVPYEVICLYVVSRALSSDYRRAEGIKRWGSKASFLFIRVQAMSSSLAASFTRILVRIPGSFARPLSFWV